MSKNFADPHYHSTASAAMKTGTETAKGAAVGAGVGGLVTGPLIGMLGGILAGAAAVSLVAAAPILIVASGAAAIAATGLVSTGILGGAALSAFGVVAAGGFAIAAGGGAIAGGFTGGGVGSIVGAITGFLTGGAKGADKGREIIAHDRGVAELSNQQTATAMAQTNTAQTLQTNAMERAQVRQHQHEAQMVQAMAVPQIQPQGMSHMGRVNETALSQEVANDSAVLASESGHAAAMEQRDAAVTAEHQV